MKVINYIEICIGEKLKREKKEDYENSK